MYDEKNESIKMCGAYNPLDRDGLPLISTVTTLMCCWSGDNVSVLRTNISDHSFCKEGIKQKLIG